MSVRDHQEHVLLRAIGCAHPGHAGRCGACKNLRRALVTRNSRLLDKMSAVSIPEVDLSGLEPSAQISALVKRMKELEEELKEHQDAAKNPIVKYARLARHYLGDCLAKDLLVAMLKNIYMDGMYGAGTFNLVKDMEGECGGRGEDILCMWQARTLPCSLPLFFRVFVSADRVDRQGITQLIKVFDRSLTNCT